EKGRICGRQAKGRLERVVCSLPIEVIIELNVRPSAQRLRQVGLESQRPSSCLPCAGKVGVEARTPNFASKAAHPQVCLCQSGPGERELGVEISCLLVFGQSLGVAFL